MTSSWKRNIIILLCVSISLTFTVVGETTVNPNSENTLLISHSPIEISSDEDFLVFPGSGTYEDPYLIENYNITSNTSFGIYITLTSKHFLIRNCYIDVSQTSILIENIVDGGARIENNICVSSEEENGDGIVIYVAKDVLIEDNICSNHESSGMVLVIIYNLVLKNNTCYANGDSGMSIAVIENGIIYENKCFENEEKGLFMGGTDAILYNNTFSRNGEEGAYLEEVSGSAIMNNTIEGNGLRGMKLDSTTGCLLNFNLFKDNKVRGLFLDDECERNRIYLNDFLNNSLDGCSQGRDEGRENYWYYEGGKKGNYWDDLNGDSKYDIEGEANSFDLYPMAEQVILEKKESEKTSFVHFDTLLFVTAVLLIIYEKTQIKYKHSND